MRTLSPLIWPIALLGCSATASPTPHGKETPTEVTVDLDRRGYGLGDMAGLTLTNSTDQTALFALACDAFLEGRSGERWETVYEPDCSAVRVRPTRLGRESVVLQLRIDLDDPASLAKHDAFRVRLRYQFTSDEGYRNAYSEVFGISGR